MAFVDLLAAFRTRPVAAAMELGSLAVCVALLAGTMVALVSGHPADAPGPWLAVIAVSAGFVTFWTVLFPLYDRLRR